MPGINGIKAAYEISAFDEKIKIIFLTSSPEFAVESYAVNTYAYILKPVNKEKIFPILSKIMFEEKDLQECMIIKCKNEIMRFFF